MLLSVQAVMGVLAIRPRGPSNQKTESVPDAGAVAQVADQVTVCGVLAPEATEPGEMLTDVEVGPAVPLALVLV